MRLSHANLHLASNLKIGYLLLVRSVEPVVYSVKLDEFASFKKDSTFIALTETWLKPEMPDGAVDILEYVFYWNDRPSGCGGAGVGIHVSQGMQHRIT